MWSCGDCIAHVILCLMHSFTSYSHPFWYLWLNTALVFFEMPPAEKGSKKTKNNLQVLFLYISRMFWAHLPMGITCQTPQTLLMPCQGEAWTMRPLYGVACHLRKEEKLQRQKHWLKGETAMLTCRLVETIHHRIVLCAIHFIIVSSLHSFQIFQITISKPFGHMSTSLISIGEFLKHLRKGLNLDIFLMLSSLTRLTVSFFAQVYKW